MPLNSRSYVLVICSKITQTSYAESHESHFESHLSRTFTNFQLNSNDKVKISIEGKVELIRFSNWFLKYRPCLHTGVEANSLSSDCR